MKKRKPVTKKKSAKTSKKASQHPRYHREILWRPDRLEYLTKNHSEKACVFCEASQKGVGFDSLVVWQSELTTVLMNKYPYNNGHLLIVPKRHIPDIEDLTEEEFLEVHGNIKLVINALRNSYTKGPDGFNVGLNLGRAAGAGLPGHLHYHVIPRWVGDSNFFPIVGQTKVISETLEQTYKRLLPYFK